ncbi:hypothetical protein [Myxococcus qinghaiensis]|uniref:hypothetical protein n=1 Tax=Myxococcus qinghaiensis TaxID=2906758 RepID=UPI0020A70477|nr:hypothetical protein [Myxococcus qinghaiensis]MCP3169548.1 hypothetical protein [Myxococcus qinghaiensis]
MRTSRLVLAVASLSCSWLMACGGDDAPNGGEPIHEAVGNQKEALYPDYDPSIHCLVSSAYVPCGDGLYMYAYSSSSWGYYIERNVCASHQGPIICPYD